MLPLNLAAAIYGTMTIGSVVAIESSGGETYPETLAAVLIAMILYWLAHSYAESASSRLRENEPLTRAGLLRALADGMPIIPGAAVPLTALLICWAAGESLSTGETATVWTSAGTIVILELVAGIRADRKGRELAAQVAFGATLGLLIIALRAVLH
jgi:hypothetical protein